MCPGIPTLVGTATALCSVQRNERTVFEIFYLPAFVGMTTITVRTAHLTSVHPLLNPLPSREGKYIPQNISSKIKKEILPLPLWERAGLTGSNKAIPP
jgi:hypothetical protein